MGLIFGFGLASIIEYLDDTIKTPTDVDQYLKTPILGTIPFLKHTAFPLMTQLSRHSALAESVRTLRSNLKFAILDEPIKTLLVTSASPAEGKTMIVANLGIGMAQAGRRVIIVDADLRHPSLHKIFGIDNSIGLTNVLVGEVDVDAVLRPAEVDGLTLLPSGPIPPNPAELLDSQPMKKLVEMLDSKADFIIFDSPPTLAVTDAQVLASNLDSVLLLLAAGEVRKDAAIGANQLLANARAKLMGVVLNKIHITREGYYYYYYHYYGEGKKHKSHASRHQNTE